MITWEQCQSEAREQFKAKLRPGDTLPNPPLIARDINKLAASLYASQAVRECTQWHPIETVPKNQWILTATAWQVLRTRLFDNSVESSWVTDFGKLHTWKPTHWMPLPSPPTT